MFKREDLLWIITIQSSYAISTLLNLIEMHFAFLQSCIVYEWFLFISQQTRTRREDETNMNIKCRMFKIGMKWVIFLRYLLFCLIRKFLIYFRVNCKLVLFTETTYACLLAIFEARNKTKLDWNGMQSWDTGWVCNGII